MLLRRSCRQGVPKLFRSFSSIPSPSINAFNEKFHALNSDCQKRLSPESQSKYTTTKLENKSLHSWGIPHYSDLGVFNDIKLECIDLQNGKEIHETMGTDFDYKALIDSTKKELALNGEAWQKHNKLVDSSMFVTNSQFNNEEDSTYDLGANVVQLAINGDHQFAVGNVIGPRSHFVPRYEILESVAEIGFFPDVHFAFSYRDEMEGIHFEVESSHARMINFIGNDKSRSPVFVVEGKRLQWHKDNLTLILKGIGQTIMYNTTLAYFFKFHTNGAELLSNIRFPGILQHGHFSFVFSTQIRLEWLQAVQNNELDELAMEYFPKTTIFCRDLHESELFKARPSMRVSPGSCKFSGFNNNIWEDVIQQTCLLKQLMVHNKTNYDTISAVVPSLDYLKIPGNCEKFEIYL